eukprot:522348-Prymnesium_polylepis.1
MKCKRAREGGMRFLSRRRIESAQCVQTKPKWFGWLTGIALDWFTSALDRRFRSFWSEATSAKACAANVA